MSRQLPPAPAHRAWTRYFSISGGFSNAYQSGIRQGGAFELKQVTWAYNLGLESPELKGDPLRLAQLKAVDLKAWFTSMPWKRGHTPLSAIPDYEDYVFDQWRHGQFDAYWKQVGIYAAGFYPQLARAATVNLSGWYDPYSRTATENYTGLKAQDKRPSRLILGPWTHGARSTTFAGDVDFGAQATFEACTGSDYYAYRLAYFDRMLKGQKTVDEHVPPVRLFVMGGGSGRRTAAGRLESWRAMAQCHRLAGARSSPHALLSACRWKVNNKDAGCRRASAKLQFRSREPGADHRRCGDVGGAVDARRCL